MKAVHHVVRMDGMNPLGTDHIVNETQDAFDWFPELKDNKIFENIGLSKVTLTVNLDKQKGLSEDVVGIYFEIFEENND